MLRVNRLYLPKSFSTLKFNTIIHKSKNVVNVNPEKINSVSINNNEPIVKNSLKESASDTIENRLSGDDLLNAYDEVIAKWKNNKITARQAMKMLGVSKSVFYRWVKN